MGQYAIGDAIQRFMRQSGWDKKVHELRLRQEWEQIVGPAIARYTNDLKLYDGRLTISTPIAALKHELRNGRDAIIARINAHFGEAVVKEIMIK